MCGRVSDRNWTFMHRRERDGKYQAKADRTPLHTTRSISGRKKHHRLYPFSGETRFGYDDEREYAKE